MEDWLRKNGSLLELTKPFSIEDQRAFANLFVSYLESSFDFLGQERHWQSSGGCSCLLCASIGDSSRLAPKKLGPADVERATRLLEAELQSVAGGVAKSPSLNKAQTEALTCDPGLREPLAIAAWMSAIFRRMRGDYVGPEALVLWRRFAWSSKGSPKRDFKMTEAAVASAQVQVKAAVLRALKA